MRRSLAILILCCAGFLCNAEGIKSLKSLCPESGSKMVFDHYVISGVVVSDCESMNMALNPQRGTEMVDVRVNLMTAYLQEEDGSAGVCLVFDNFAYNALHQFDLISLDLRGGRIIHEVNPDRVRVEGLTSFNVIEYAHGAPVAPKQKFISELTDDDVYTLVSLKNVEMLYKDGAYTEVLESYVQQLPALHKDCDYVPRNALDGWMTMLRDGNGGHIYMMVNSLCPWRRSGKMLPQGKGSVVGIIDNCTSRRFGGSAGRYSIRPLDEKSIMLDKKASSNWTRLAGWELDGSDGPSLKFHKGGIVEGLNKKGKSGDRVVNNSGKGSGLMWSDSGLSVWTGSSLGSITVDNKGFQSNSTILFRGATDLILPEGGEDKGSIMVDVDASKVSGTQMTFNLSWFGGDKNPDHCWGYPSFWNVFCSVDGEQWTLLEDAVTGQTVTTLLPIPVFSRAIKGLGKKSLPYDCAVGTQMHSYALPGEVFGKKHVMIRLTPADEHVFVPRTKPSNDAPGFFKNVSSKKYKTTISFCKVTVDYR